MANALATATSVGAAAPLVEVLLTMGARTTPVLASDLERWVEELIIEGHVELRDLLGPAPRRHRLYSALQLLVAVGDVEDDVGGLRLPSRRS